jgi:phenylacetate-coenzyme A ligase PaaK-like adenylate-forming protein
MTKGSGLPDIKELEQRIFRIGTEAEFRQVAWWAFLYQYETNPVYRQFCDLLNAGPQKVQGLDQVPFLPVEMFKNHRILAGNQTWEKVFRSSGTTGMERSSHFIHRLELYRESFLKGFESFYGPVQDYCILAFLPGYTDNPDSSLIYMVQHLIREGGHPESGFFPNDPGSLVDKLRELEKRGQKTLLLGVSFALLEMAERYHVPLKNTIVMETGGMKGRRAEITREELHHKLKKSFDLQSIHSEYGMAELLSQAYSHGEGQFRSPPWMKVMIRDYYDPFQYMETGQSGGINIIDLANLHSCPFIETKDIGKLHPKGSFEVLGRFDYSDIRGCNLLSDL